MFVHSDKVIRLTASADKTQIDMADLKELVFESQGTVPIKFKGAACVKLLNKFAIVVTSGSDVQSIKIKGLKIAFLP